MLSILKETIKVYLIIAKIAIGIPLSPIFLIIEILIETIAWLTALPLGGIPFGSFALGMA